MDNTLGNNGFHARFGQYRHGQLIYGLLFQGHFNCCGAHVGETMPHWISAAAYGDECAWRKGLNHNGRRIRVDQAGQSGCRFHRGEVQEIGIGDPIIDKPRLRHVPARVREGCLGLHRFRG